MTYAIQVTLTNEDKGYQFSEWTEELDEYLLKDDGTPDTGQVYRLLQREYGRCTSSVYVDRKNGRPVKVGWFFISRQQYEDTNEPYLRGAWCTLVETHPTTMVEMGGHR